MTSIIATDLFCGAGGFSTGLLQAARAAGVTVNLTAVNHWDIAITTHSVNHPGARHVWADIEGVQPRTLVPGGRLHAMLASPECIYFSKARGGKPINDQRRSSAQYVLTWLQELRVDELLLENVEEFERWGPLYPADHPEKKLRNRPIPERRGELFADFVAQLHAMGYHVEWRVLCAADYGDATTRRRFFLRASRKRSSITWPEPTHRRAAFAVPSTTDDIAATPLWRSARQVIDWTDPGTSIYRRDPLLCPATMRRILAGLRKFSGLQPFLTEYHGDHPGTRSGDRRTRSIDEPLATQDTSNRFGLVSPYLVVYRNHADALPTSSPLPTICAEGQHLGVASPYLINLKGQSTAATIDAPMPTQTAHAQHLGVVNPYLVKYYGTGAAVSVDNPLDTVTTVDRFGLAQPYLTAVHDYLRQALQHPDPLYHPRLVEIDGTTYLVDVLYRMLKPRELANSMSFPADYVFYGNQGDQVRQIGNAVPVGMATALCQSML